MRYLLDTNVFYDLEDGTLDEEAFEEHYKDHDLYSSMINFIEISTSTRTDTAKKVNVARKLLKYDMVPDSNEVLKEHLIGEKALNNSAMYISNINDFVNNPGDQQVVEYLQDIEGVRTNASLAFKEDVNRIRPILYIYYGGKKNLESNNFNALIDDLPDLIDEGKMLDILTDRLRDAINDNSIKCKYEEIPTGLRTYVYAYYAYILRKIVEDEVALYNDYCDLEQLIYCNLYVDKVLSSDSMINDILVNYLEELIIENPREK
ncbi:MAG: hypothetical protein GF399_00020 [Candidatus Coatesbacteria bacterium]|nr:hypothetical protein [Candidatus Coatesbacteria bacterium]